MKISKQPYPITTLHGLRNRIDPTPDFQRPPVWSKKQKQLLIDTILRGYDVPKMYWQRLKNGAPFEFAVIDGQQRLRTIWEFYDGEFALAKDTDPVDGVEIAKMKCDDLDFNLRAEFDSYRFDVVIVDDAVQIDEEDEVRDMFLRLQNGTTLKAQEKRNAMSGQMRGFIKKIADHKYFESCHFSNSRFTFDHIAAQMVRLEMAEGPVSVRDGDLNKMYVDNQSFDPNGKVAKKVRRVLDYLLRAFPDKTPELERYSVIVLYCLASALIGRYAHAGTEKKLAEWFIKFETERRKNEKLEEKKRDPELVEYRRLTSQSTDSEESIRARLEFIEKRFFLACPDIEPLDESRIFTPEQRLAIYRKFDGYCQLDLGCEGEQLPWAGWHADHIVPHSQGGKTIVSNGQVACPHCNLVKSNMPDPNRIAAS